MLADGLEVSAEAQEALTPGIFKMGGFHRAHPRQEVLSSGGKEAFVGEQTSDLEECVAVCRKEAGGDDAKTLQSYIDGCQIPPHVVDVDKYCSWGSEYYDEAYFQACMKGAITMRTLVKHFLETLETVDQFLESEESHKLDGHGDQRKDATYVKQPDASSSDVVKAAGKVPDVSSS